VASGLEVSSISLELHSMLEEKLEVAGMPFEVHLLKKIAKES
jgi:hypothetical protein